MIQIIEDTRTPAQRAAEFAAYIKERDERLAGEQTTRHAAARELAAQYGDDPSALSHAAECQPISMQGNQRAEELRFAAAIIRGA